VVSAGDPESPAARAALEELCRTYWYPLYAFVRRTGRNPHDAEDLVQGFFAACLSGRYLDAADPARGRFRSFLLLLLKRHLANAWDKERAAKRGGGQSPVSLDALSAEERYALEPANDLTPDRLYERRWALTLLERVLDRLAAEQAAAGKADSFARLRAHLAGGDSSTPYATLATELGLSEGALKVAVHRLRRRYRTLLENEIARTVADPAEVADERRHLLSVLAA
jgi:RNA polymerase sigma factor (sigma-70 family)